MYMYTNSDLYQIALDRLRKDRKGSVSPEEFENFLNIRSIDYFNQQMGAEGITKKNQSSITNWLVWHEVENIQAGDGLLYVAFTDLEYVYADLANVWYSASGTDLSNLVPIDIVTPSEYHDRLTNAITAPSATYPIGILYNAPEVGTEDWWDLSNPYMEVHGVPANFVVIDYYRIPYNAYLDYYINANGDITIMQEGEYTPISTYTLKAGEVSRGGDVAPTEIVSLSTELEWPDQDAMNILDMVMTDLGVAQSDQGVTQSSVFERQQNVSS